MTNILTSVGDKNITNEDLITYLKLSGKIKTHISELMLGQIVRNYFEKNNMEIPLKDLQKNCDLYRASRGLYKAKATEEWMQKKDIVIEDFEKFIETDLMVRQIKSQVASPEKVSEFFENNKSDYDIAVVSHIVIPEEGQASLILTEIHDEGENFEDMAKKHSIDIDSATSGGYIGPLRRNALSKDISDKIFMAEASEIIGPLETDDGFELIRIEQKTKTQKINDEIKAEIAHNLFMLWLKKEKEND